MIDRSFDNFEINGSFSEGAIYENEIALTIKLTFPNKY
jgi:hypothetical protein